MSNCVLCDKPLCHWIYYHAYKGLAHWKCKSWQVRGILWFRSLTTQHKEKTDEHSEERRLTGTN